MYISEGGYTAINRALSPCKFEALGSHPLAPARTSIRDLAAWNHLILGAPGCMTPTSYLIAAGVPAG